jgi:hypothetical protein
VTPSPSPGITPSPSPVPSPSPSPVLTEPALPAPAAGSLPGQNLAMSGEMKYPLLVQVENTDASRPQAGIAAGSVIFHYLTEGGITRLSVLFHHVPGVVGPVRSARFVSVYLYHRFDALLLCSGGSKWTYDKIFADPGTPAIINDFDYGKHYFRWSGRAAPHNLYIKQDKLLELGNGDFRPPKSDDLLRSTTWAGTEAVTTINVPDLRSTFTYSGGTYGVVTDGKPQADVVFGSVRPHSVVVMHVRQWIDPVVQDAEGGHVHDFDLNSGGTAEIYANGTVIRGRWKSPAENQPLQFTDAGGNPVGLPAGQAWVELAS